MFGLLCTGAVFRGLFHLWSHLKQDGLGCKTSVPGQSQAQYLKWPEIQQNTQQVCSGTGQPFPSPCPALAEQPLDFWEFHPLWRAGTTSASVALLWDGFVLEAGARVR